MTLTSIKSLPRAPLPFLSRFHAPDAPPLSILPSLPPAKFSTVCPLAHSVASLLVYVRGEGRLAVRLCVRSGCVYICLALEPGTWSRAPVHPGHRPVDCSRTWGPAYSDSHCAGLPDEWPTVSQSHACPFI